MTYEEAIALLKPAKYTNPGPVMAKMMAECTTRTESLHSVKPVDNVCVWCNAAEVKKPKRKYCSQCCSDSAWMGSNPQCDKVKGYVLIALQGCACAACGLVWEDTIRAKIQTFYNHFSLGYYKRNKQAMPDISYGVAVHGTGHLLQVDHRIPIFKGGASLGLENIQVICATCHYTKTAAERKSV